VRRGEFHLAALAPIGVSQAPDRPHAARQGLGVPRRRSVFVETESSLGADEEPYFGTEVDVSPRRSPEGAATIPDDGSMKVSAKNKCHRSKES